jgi:tetratricopeptide (TPR) repeat protein
MRQVGRRQTKVAQELQLAGENGWQALYDAAAGNPLALDWTLGLIAQKGYSFNTALERLRNAAASSDLYGFLFNDAVQGLAKIDRTLLSVLSVFLSPATVDALIDIAELTPTEIRSGLERLIALSLVNDLEGDRFGLHPLTRNYVIVALGKTTPSIPITAQLDANDQRKALRYWVDYAQKYGGYDNDAYKTYDKLEAEWQTLESIANNLRELSGIPSPLQDPQAAQMLIDLETALHNFLNFRGYWDERMRLSEWCYEAGQALSKWSDAGWGAYRVATTHYRRGEIDRAATWTDKMATAMERGGSRRDRAAASQMQGRVAEQRKEWKKAEQFYQETVAAFQDIGDEDAKGTILSDLGDVAKKQQQYDRAETYYQQALAIDEKQEDKQGQAVYCGNLGLLAIERDRPKDARPWFERELSLAQEVGRQDQVAAAQSGLALVLAAEKRYGEALTLAQQALQIRERLGADGLAFSRSQVERLQRLVKG